MRGEGSSRWEHTGGGKAELRAWGGVTLVGPQHPPLEKHLPAPGCSPVRAGRCLSPQDPQGSGEASFTLCNTPAETKFNPFRNPTDSTYGRFAAQPGNQKGTKSSGTQLFSTSKPCRTLCFYKSSLCMCAHIH